MNEENLKIGMYTENEIFDYMTEQEGGMLGRSMYDAIFDKIHKLITENQQLKEQLELSEKARKEAIEYINKTEYSDIVGLNSNSIKEFWFVKELLNILDKGE